LFAIELVALSCSFRVQLFGASPKPLFASPTFRKEPEKGLEKHHALFQSPYSHVRDVSTMPHTPSRPS
ncbi:MAG: hypothetical protein UDR59_05185, partial [Christensenellales bacterium]|nr:hypothetical protein [Christensenellales bacterium]